MIDFNHDGKIDERDYIMYKEFIESEKEDEYKPSRSSGGSKSGNNGKISLLEFIGVMTIIAVIGFLIMAFTNELVATAVIIIIGILLISKG